MVINGRSLLALAPIKDMLQTKEALNGCSHGLTEAGYDIRIKQSVIFKPDSWGPNTSWTATAKWNENSDQHVKFNQGKFILASTVEEFAMPESLLGIVHDKSTWARRGLSVLNTCIEPGWKGWLTLELVYHGSEELVIPAGTGIAQVIFHHLVEPANYNGKYQNQENAPVAAKNS